MFLGASGCLLANGPEPILKCGVIGDVLAERALGGDGLALMIWRNGAVVDAMRPLPQMLAAFAIADQQRLPVCPSDIVDDAVSVRCQAPCESRADAVNRSDRHRTENGFNLVRRQDGKAPWLVQFARHLGEEAVGRQANGNGDPDLGFDLTGEICEQGGWQAGVQSARA